MHVHHLVGSIFIRRPRVAVSFFLGLKSQHDQLRWLLINFCFDLFWLLCAFFFSFFILTRNFDIAVIAIVFALCWIITRFQSYKLTFQGDVLCLIWKIRPDLGHEAATSEVQINNSGVLLRNRSGALIIILKGLEVGSDCLSPKSDEQSTWYKAKAQLEYPK